MTSTREGDFDSILDDDSLDDESQKLEALKVLSENDWMIRSPDVLDENGFLITQK